MNNEETSAHSTVMIVSSYVRHHTVRPEQLSDLITIVHHALGHLGQPVQAEEVLVPTLSVRRSVHHDYVVCLDCGYRGKTLRRHISTRHGFNRDEYVRRWGLRSDHPLNAPAYSEQRSTLAKAIGLGRKSTAQASLEVSPPAAPRPADVDQGSQATPARGQSRVASKSADVTSEAVTAPSPTGSRRSRSASKSLTPDSGNEAVAEQTPASRRRPRPRVASPQPEQTSSPTAET